MTQEFFQIQRDIFGRAMPVRQPFLHSFFDNDITDTPQGRCAAAFPFFLPPSLQPSYTDEYPQNSGRLRLFQFHPYKYVRRAFPHMRTENIIHNISFTS